MWQHICKNAVFHRRCSAAFVLNMPKHEFIVKGFQRCLSVKAKRLKTSRETIGLRFSASIKQQSSWQSVRVRHKPVVSVQFSKCCSVSTTVSLMKWSCGIHLSGWRPGPAAPAGVPSSPPAWSSADCCCCSSAPSLMFRIGEKRRIQHWSICS